MDAAALFVSGARGVVPVLGADQGQGKGYTPGMMTPSEGLRPSVRALIRLPLWRRWAAAPGLSRLPVAMVPLAFVLAGQYAIGSFAAGALLVSVHALSEAVAAPWGGRLLDRDEVRGDVQQALVVAAGALALLAGAVSLRAPLPLLLLLTAAVGTIPVGGLGQLPPLSRGGAAWSLQGGILMRGHLCRLRGRAGGLGAARGYRPLVRTLGATCRSPRPPGGTGAARPISVGSLGLHAARHSRR